MAHELNFTNGAADVLSVRQSMWHREGHIFQTAPSLADAIAVCHMDYTVEKRATNYHGGFDADGKEVRIASQKAFVTVRTDTHKELGAVGPDYTPLQNKDAFAVLEPLLESEYCSISTAGVLRGGADAWVLVEWDRSKFEGEARLMLELEGIQPFGFIANNHDGRRGILVAQTPIRIVCANTLGMAEGNGAAPNIIVRHTTEVAANLKAAAEEVFGEVIRRYTIIAEQYKALKAAQLSDGQFKKLVLDVVTPDPRDKDKWNPEARMAANTLERHEKRVGEITRLWTEGRGHTGERNAYYAYNAAVEAIDHHDDLWPRRSGVYQTGDRHLHGNLGKMKSAVLNNLVDFARSGRN